MSSSSTPRLSISQEPNRTYRQIVLWTVLLGLVAFQNSVLQAQSRGSSPEPELKVLKTNDTAGEFSLPDGSFHWDIKIENTGDKSADFAEGARVLLDEFPAGPTYGAPSVINESGTTGSLDCSMSGDALTCTAATGGAYKMSPNAEVTVRVEVTPSVEGTLNNPAVGGTCAVDPDDVVPESNEANGCSDSVEVTGVADLIATKTNDVAGDEFDLADGSFNWSITVTNIGTSAMVWNDTGAVLVDEAPDSVHDGVTYGTPQITAQSQVTGTISCALSDLSLIDPNLYDYTSIQCTASGQVTMEIGGSFTLTVEATPSSTGVLENPIRDNFCGVISQPGDESDQTNNDCADAVTVVHRPDLTATKTNDVGSSTELAEGPFTWSILIQNDGGQPAVFPEDDLLFIDYLGPSPHPNLEYGGSTVSGLSGVTGTPICETQVNGADEELLVCYTSISSGLTIDPGGSFTVAIEVTPLIAGMAINPMVPPPSALHVCAVDPIDLVGESNEDNNACSDSVDVADSPDALVTKTNDAGGVVEVGVPFTWTILLENVGGAELVIPDGETVLVDYLPEGLTYGDPVVTELALNDLAGPLECEVGPADEPLFPAMQLLECTAGTGGIGIVAGGGVTIEWTATPTVDGAFENPHQDFPCQVDPDDVDAELDETNNDCADRVEVPIFADGFESGNTLAWN